MEAEAFAEGFAGHQATPLDVVTGVDAAGVQTVKTSRPMPLNLLTGYPAQPGAIYQKNAAQNPVTGALLAGLLLDLIEPRLETLLNEIPLPFPARPEIKLADRAEEIRNLRAKLAGVRGQRETLEAEIRAITSEKLASMTPDPATDAAMAA